VTNRPTDRSAAHKRALLLITAALFVSACRGTQNAQRVAVDERAEWFVDHAADVGLDFTHFNGMSGEVYYAEHMGAGVALFDYDNDGRSRRVSRPGADARRWKDTERCPVSAEGWQTAPWSVVPQRSRDSPGWIERRLFLGRGARGDEQS
jgi:hypothetical protein